jgi:hypothetical protein
MRILECPLYGIQEECTMPQMCTIRPLCSWMWWNPPGVEDQGHAASIVEAEDRTTEQCPPGRTRGWGSHQRQWRRTNAYFSSFLEDVEAEEQINVVLLEEEHINLCTEAPWFLDSGASSHVTGNRSLLTDITSARVSSIKIAAGQTLLVVGKGNVTAQKANGEIKQARDVLPYVRVWFSNFVSK